MIADGASVFNETGVDVDFRIESDDNANMLFVDGGNDRVGIGVGDTSGTNLEVEQGSATGAELQHSRLIMTIQIKVAMTIEAANIDADVIDIAADAVTTAKSLILLLMHLLLVLVSILMIILHQPVQEKQ